MNKSIQKLVLVLLSFSLLMGCGASKDEAINESKEVAKTAFQETKMKPTETTNGISYYLPEDFKVQSETENNIILLNARQEYILFINPQEAQDSEVALQKLKKIKGTTILDTFKDDERFGFVSIAPLEGKEYELVVGIGGVKLTTKTKIKNMAKNTKAMMEIVNSVKYKVGVDK